MPQSEGVPSARNVGDEVPPVAAVGDCVPPVAAVGDEVPPVAAVGAEVPRMAAARGPAPERMRDAETAYREARPLLLVMARNAGFNEVEQREIAQKVGLVLVEKADEYDPEKGTPRMWAVGIARNILLDARRAARLERRRTDRMGSLKRIPSPDLTPEETLRARELLLLSREGVREEHRAVFDLDAQGCTTSEIAEKLGMSTPIVGWRLREARKDLDQTLVLLGEDRKEITRVRDTFFLGVGLQTLSTSWCSPEPADPGETVTPGEAGSADVTITPERVSRRWAVLQSASPWAMAAMVVLAIGGIAGIVARVSGLATARHEGNAADLEGWGSRATSGTLSAQWGSRATSGTASPQWGSRATSGTASLQWGSRATSGTLSAQWRPASGLEVPCSAPAEPPGEAPVEGAGQAGSLGANQGTPSEHVRGPAIRSARGPGIASVRRPATGAVRRREWLVIRTLLGLRRDAEAAALRGGGGVENPHGYQGFSIK